MRVSDLDRDMSDVIPTATSPDSSFLFERMADETLEATRPRPGARVLDAAAGLGQDSRALSSRGVRSVCAEPSRRMTSLGRMLDAEQGGDAAWVQAWSERLPFADGSFDAAFCKGALDHFDDPARCIAELARVVRPDGRVVVAVANFDALGCRVQRLVDRLRRQPTRGRRTWHVPSDHFTRYDPALLRAQLEPHVTIERWTGISLLWGVRAWVALLERLPASWATGLLRLADAAARALPSLSDVIVVAGPPRQG